MFDLGWSEFLIVAVVTIVVVGPRELPRVLKTVSSAVRTARRYASDFQRSVMDVADLNDLNDMRKTLTAEQEEINKNMRDAAIDMDAMRQEWEMDWDAELGIDKTDQKPTAKKAVAKKSPTNTQQKDS